MPSITGTPTNFELHTENEWYPAHIEDILDGDDYGYGPTIKWVFALDNEERETWGMTSQSASPRSKAYKWIKGLRGTGIAEGETIKLETFIGWRCAVMFEHKGEGEDLRDRVVNVKRLTDKPDLTPSSTDSKDAPF